MCGCSLPRFAKSQERHPPDVPGPTPVPIHCAEVTDDRDLPNTPQQLTFSNMGVSQRRLRRQGVQTRGPWARSAG